MSTINIKYSSELMSNYMQADTAAPDQKFEALQTDDGHSLLFSIGTDNILYLTEEIPSQDSKTGWQKSDLSSSLSSNFDEGAVISAKTFAVDQNHEDNTFCVLLALTVNNVDHLYIATSYTRNDDSMVSVDWEELPYDATGEDLSSSLNITDIYLQQNAGQPLIIVDLADPGDGNIDRYYIDSQKYQYDQYWNLFTIPVDMDASQPVLLCGGRKAGENLVAGTYTLGNVGGEQSIIYQQLYDPWGDGAGSASRLNLPNGAVPNAIASAPSVGTPSTQTVTYTDLYVCSEEGDLYIFTADNQHDHAVATKIMTNALFGDMNGFYAYTTEDMVVVWGLNRGQEVFYTQCEKADIADTTAWSFPLSLASGIEQITPYVNRINGGNTYFAHTGENTFKKVFQDPVTTIWQNQNIQLPTDTNATAQKFDSYTTTISTVDEANNPIVDAPVLISSSYRVPVYINNHYYVLDVAPITVSTNNQGSITVIQPVEDMQGATLTVAAAAGEGSLVINPMDNANEKTAQLNTPESLSAATVTDDKGNPTGPLVSPDTSEDDLNSTAAAMTSLSSAYDDCSSTDAAAKRSARPIVPRRRNKTQMKVVGGVTDAIEVAAGDLFNHLKQVEKYVVQIIEDVATGAYNFLCEIEGIFYTFVIDTVEAVVGAIQCVFQAIETVISDLIQFAKFLFSWGDIGRTKDVFKNISMIFMQNAIDSIGDVQDGLDDVLDGMQAQIDNWANLPSPTVSDTTDSVSSSEDTSDMNTASSSFFAYHLSNNANNSTYTGSADDANLPETLFNDLVNSLKTEETIITDALQLFYDQVLANNNYRNMSIDQFIKTTIGILGDAAIQSAKNVADTFLEMVSAVAETIMSILTQPIRIPILSDILEEFFDFTIPFSWLDVLLYVAALPATLSYKIIRMSAPFTEDDGFSEQLINASNMAELQAIIMGAPTQSKETRMAKTESEPTLAQTTIFFVSRFISSATDFVAALLVYPANTPGLKGLQFVKAANIFNKLVGVISGAVVSIFASPIPLQNTDMRAYHITMTTFIILDKIIFAGYIIYAKLKKLETQIAMENEKICFMIFKVLDGITVFWHLCEIVDNILDNPPAQSSLAIAQIGAQTCDIGNSAMTMAAALTPEGVTKNVELGCSLGLSSVKGVLEFVQCVTAEFAVIAEAQTT